MVEVDLSWGERETAWDSGVFQMPDFPRQILSIFRRCWCLAALCTGFAATFVLRKQNYLLVYFFRKIWGSESFIAKRRIRTLLSYTLHMLRIRAPSRFVPSGTGGFPDCTKFPLVLINLRANRVGAPHSIPKSLLAQSCYEVSTALLWYQLLEWDHDDSLNTTSIQCVAWSKETDFQ